MGIWIAHTGGGPVVAWHPVQVGNGCLLGEAVCPRSPVTTHCSEHPMLLNTSQHSKPNTHWTTHTCFLDLSMSTWPWTFPEHVTMDISCVWPWIFPEHMIFWACDPQNFITFSKHFLEIHHNSISTCITKSFTLALETSPLLDPSPSCLSWTVPRASYPGIQLLHHSAKAWNLNPKYSNPCHKFLTHGSIEIHCTLLDYSC